MKDVVFGQYYPSDSGVHHMDARAKVLLMLAYVVLIFFVDSFVGYFAYLVFVLTVALIAKVPLRTLFRSVKGVAILVVFISIINVFFSGLGEPLWKWWILSVSVESLLHAAKMALRILLLVMGPAILTYTTTPMELTDAIESLLSPLKLVRFPVRDVAVIMSIALRMVPTLMEETDRIMLAQKARGASLDSGNIFKRVKALVPILIPLFVGAFRRAEELALALDARCYNASPKRTRYRVLRLTWRDLVGLLVFGVLLTVIVLNLVLYDFDGMIWNLIMTWVN
ncbi:MAG: energy-coupling factor transporter transmembrane protein EcfT [Clostridia bacterium]|nr:energy-coupling factor transporter transmembrane protein EcfT [Clostridia bacterium]